MCGCLLRGPHWGPDWESNRQPFGLQSRLNPMSYTSWAENHFLLVKLPACHNTCKGLRILLRFVPRNSGVVLEYEKNWKGNLVELSTDYL